MTCEALFRRMGFECHERSAGVYRVFTPLSFADGEPIGFYLDETGNIVRLSDNADTLFHFRSVGFDVSDRKKWQSISRIINSFGMSLHHSGEVIGISMASAASGLVSRYLGAMLAIADLERDMMNVTPTDTLG